MKSCGLDLSMDIGLGSFIYHHLDIAKGNTHMICYILELPNQWRDWASSSINSVTLADTARDKRTRIRSVRSSHWTTIKRETGSWFIECRGFLVCLKQQTLEWSQNLFITLPTELGTVVPNGIQSFHGEVSICFGETAFPEVDRFALWSTGLSFSQRWVSGASGPEWRNLVPPTFLLLPVSKIMLKNRAEKLAEGTRGRGGWGERVKQNGLWIWKLPIILYHTAQSPGTMISHNPDFSA